MDISKYFRSPDIASHCEAIGKTFTPIEMATIVQMSNCTLAEKHEGYRQIVTEYPDMQIPEVH